MCYPVARALSFIARLLTLLMSSSASRSSTSQWSSGVFSSLLRSMPLRLDSKNCGSWSLMKQSSSRQAKRWSWKESGKEQE